MSGIEHKCPNGHEVPVLLQVECVTCEASVAYEPCSIGMALYRELALRDARAVKRIEALERELGYAIDALEGKPWTGWSTDTARDTLQGGQ